MLLPPSGKLESGGQPPPLASSSAPNLETGQPAGPAWGYRLEALGKESSPRGESSRPLGTAPLNQAFLPT